tara:strand:- start:1675 stop:2064 length:390 start_codon:yes stop_codon:yes gene_type:complete
MSRNFQKKAEEMIRHTDDRATSNRIHILSILLAEQQALTHREIEARLSMKQQLDRVTLYRVLEWINNKNLAYKIASDDRVWRFRANMPTHAHQHAHFECTCCTKVICLDDLKLEFNMHYPLGIYFKKLN